MRVSAGFIPVLALSASMAVASEMQPIIEMHETIVTAAVVRRSSPLSQLVSEGIAFGNSLLSGLMHQPSSQVTTTTSTSSIATSNPTSSPSSGHSSSIASSSSTLSSISSTTTTSSSSSSTNTISSTSISSNKASQESSMASHTPSPSSSGGGSHNNLAIILGVVLGVLLLMLILLCVWFCLRHRRSNGSTWDSEEGKSITWGNRSPPPAPEWVETSYPIPSPPGAAAQGTHERYGHYRDGYYQRLDPPRESKQISPVGSRHHSCSPIMEEEQPSLPPTARHSVEMEGTPISPMCELPANNDTSHFAWLPKNQASNGRRSFSNLPSQKSTMSALDFGFGNDEIERRQQRRFSIPRRPISAMSGQGFAQ